MALHTLLGASGTIAKELIPVLQENKQNIRLVSRSAKPVAGMESIAADLLNADAIKKAVAGSDMVYLLAGIEYNHKVWQRDWPIIMRNVIEACKAAGAPLIFFDNVYPYGIPEGNVITEETHFAPRSKKGMARTETDTLLLNEIKSGGIKAIITRAADFYGPRVTDKSAPGILVFSRMKKGLAPQWLVNPTVPRSFSYTPDAAKAIYILSQHPEAFNQTWILPSAQPALTGKAFIALVAKYMGGKTKPQVLPKWLIATIGWFNPMMKEMHEMLYQDEFGYVLDSTKFENTFGFVPTAYEEGVKKTAGWYLAN